MAHRLAWLYVTGSFPKHQIDHINMVKSDNSFLNLREATRSENGANRKKYSNNTSGYKGVSRNTPNGRWKARIRKNGAGIHLGLFDTAKEAHIAYCSAAKNIHGEYFNKG